MAPFQVGDVVWVRTGAGSNEEPATVIDVDCQTDDGDVGVKCKLHVSFFQDVFAMDHVRLMPTGRPKRVRTRTSDGASAVQRKVVTPSPTPELLGKRKDSDSQTALNDSKKKKSRKSVSSSPHFDNKTESVNDLSKTGRKELVVSDESDSVDPVKTMTPKKNTVKSLHTTAAKRKRLISSKPPTKKTAIINTDESDDDESASKFSEESEGLDVDSDSSEDSSPRSSNKTDAVKKKAPSSKRQQPNREALDDELSDSSPLSTLKKPPGKSKKVAPKMTSPAVSHADIGTQIPTVDDGSDSESDRPYKVEYSPSGRATCRRCDEVIPKGAVRISHVPLFRGKPGYTVYRHLQCAVFSEEVTCAEDVGGWKKLCKEDYLDLARRVADSVEEIKNENEELDPDELVPVSFQGEMREAPDGLEAMLLPFQIEGVSWMYYQETSGESGVRGGMLCDEMGMGKTIQSIATILDNRPLMQHGATGVKLSTIHNEVMKAEEALWAKHHQEWEHEMKMNNVPASILPKTTGKLAKGGFRGGTLVICPVIALSQWKTEIEKFTRSGSLTVGIYHGPDRSKETPREIMCKYDVVLTTYQVLEADFRKMTSPNKIKCPNCGGKFKIDKLRIHLKYFCGEGAMRTEAQARQRRSRDDSNRDGERQSREQRREPSVKSRSKATPVKKFSSKGLSDSDEFDSESESLDLNPQLITKGRSSRKASVTARKRMSSSKKEWVIDKIEDSDEFVISEASSEDGSSESDRSVAPMSKLKKSSMKKSVIDDSNELNIHSSGKRKASSLKVPPKDLKGKEKTTRGKSGSSKRTKKSGVQGKRKSHGDRSDDDESDDLDPSDPMNGVDMEALMKEAMDGSMMSVLHSICWWRIILDEAHFIKSRSSQTANAAFALISVNRWCLSGTPLQNRVGEFYSLIRFLRIDPMAHYFCRAKECTCKSLHYRMLNGRCQDCGHGSVQHFSHFNKHVLNPIQRAGYAGDGRRAMFTLKREILDKSLLRRTKENRAADMKLPPRLVSIRAVRLHPVEEDFYNALYTQTQSSFNDYVDQGTLLNNYAHIFDLLMRMRQAVDHPYLVVYSNKDTKARANNGMAIAAGTADCEICNEAPTELVVSSCCEGAFCRSCVQDYMAVDRQGSIPCPGCRRPFSIDLTQPSNEIIARPSTSVCSEPMPQLKDLSNVPSGSILRRINLAEFATSTKIEALVEELVVMSETSPGSKAIVFSQFVNMLDLIRWRLHSDPCLKDMGLGVRALHGGMDVKARDASLKDFRENANVRVLLMSLKAGGVALNLTVANNIYLMDPWWNPAAEMQAIDRTHRLGQYRPIRAIRFIAEDTVEERILQLQEKKRLVFDGTIGRDAGSLTMLTVDDMKSLFA